MEISKIKDGKILTIKIAGKVDSKAAKELEKTLKEATTDQPSEIKIDLEKIISISSAALRALVAFKKNMAKNNCEFSIVNITNTVREVLDITGFSSMLGI